MEMEFNFMALRQEQLCWKTVAITELCAWQRKTLAQNVQSKSLQLNHHHYHHYRSDLSAEQTLMLELVLATECIRNSFVWIRISLINNKKKMKKKRFISANGRLFGNDSQFYVAFIVWMHIIMFWMFWNVVTSLFKTVADKCWTNIMLSSL